MKQLSLLLIGLFLATSPALIVTAQGTAEAAPCTDFQRYWEALVSTRPDDVDGETAFLAIVDAGTRTLISADQQRLASTFLSTWSGNITALDPALIPESARLFHNDLISDFDSTSGMIKYTDPNDLGSIFSFMPIGIYVLLIDEADTPTQCS